MQQLQALWLQSSRPEAHPGDIAARAAEARHETAFDWIAAADEHDRYGRGGSPGRAHGDIWADDHGHLPLRQVRASAGSRSSLFSAQRNSIATLWPSMNPASFRPSRNADTRSMVSAAVLAPR